MTAQKSKLYHFIKSKYIIWTKWEYMPMLATNIPVFICYLYYSLRSGSITFFKWANPGVPMGGAFGISKYDMMKDVSNPWLPKMLLIKKGQSVDQLINELNQNEIDYPIIIKPDIGERGFFVKKIIDENELKQYLSSMPCDMIVQKFIDLPHEYTLSFYSLPENPESFTITSICKKGFMQIKGDGIHTGRELMALDRRLYLQITRFENEHSEWLDKIIEKDQIILPEPVGNHNRGTAFFDARHLISKPLIDTYRNHCLNLKGIYIGRFDLKANSEQDFIKGNVNVLELNGVLGEPVHVYDPNYSPINAYKDLFSQWNTIYRISKLNRTSNRLSFSFKEAYQLVKEYFEHKKSLKSIR